MRYAVAVADLVQRPMLGQLVKPFTHERTLVEVERRRFDGDALVLDCPEEQAEAIVGVIRAHYKRHVVRCYRLEGTTVVRV